MQGSRGGDMTLLYASARGYTEDARRLINRQTVNERDDMGNTPLHLAAAAGHLPIVMALVREQGVDVNAQNSLGKTPLHDAVWRNNEQVVKFLIETVKVKTDIRDKDDHVARDLARKKEIKKLIPLEEDEWGNLSD
eukprot:TRINITY_DN2528_c0_g2_i1.p1 TRINITY_DN2528_c0_g2~~TRINITY_DN2528_c0_g2_i1.p1  ORF type:complete len:136 (-),score=27.55 TRINITY_DN2528_c0_g2_i1:108-515(-)